MGLIKNKQLMKIEIINLDEFLSCQNPINTIYKPPFKVLSELEDIMIENHDLPIWDNIICIDYKDGGMFIFEFEKYKIDELKIITFYFRYTGSAS